MMRSFRRWIRSAFAQPASTRRRPCRSVPLQLEPLEGRLVLSTVGSPSPTLFVTGADAGGGPNVVIFDAATHKQLTSFFAYEPTFTGGVRVALGDVNNDGTQDIITAPGPGRSPEVKVYDGTTFNLMFSFMAYSPQFTGGVWVAAGDVNADGFADIICGADKGGGPNIAVYDGKALAAGQDAAHALLFSFFAYDPGFTGGVRMATGDVNGDGHADIICGAGPGGGPNVTVYDGRDASRIYSFFAFDSHFANGIYVAAGDVSGDGLADILVGAGPGGGPNVTVFSGRDASMLLTLLPYDAGFNGGVRVASVVRDGQPYILSVAGPGGGPDVRIFNVTGQTVDAFFAYDPRFTGGIYVVGSQDSIPVTGKFLDLYNVVGGTRLGRPVGRSVQVDDGTVDYQEFEHGALVGPAGQPAIAVLGDIFSRWKELGGIDGPLGFPVSGGAVIHGTHAQDFQDGWLVSNSTGQTLAVQGGTSADFTLLVSDAAMLGPGLSLTDPNSLGLWTPVVDDLRTLGNDIAKVNTPEVVNLRTSPPAPFRYDPDLVAEPPTTPKLHLSDTDVYQSGTINWSFYSSMSPAALWGNQTTEGQVVSEVERRLNAMVNRAGIRQDPLFQFPVKFVLVDQIYDPNTGKPYPANVVGLNSPRPHYRYRVWTDHKSLADASAARVIQIKKWNDSTEIDQTIKTMIHEIGHSWNTDSAPTEGLMSTPWLQLHAQYFTQFEALSGWRITGKDVKGNDIWQHDPSLSFNNSLAASDFASSYAESGGANEDWAETFELASRPGLDMSSLSSLLRQKVNLVRSFLQLVVPDLGKLNVSTQNLVKGT